MVFIYSENSLYFNHFITYILTLFQAKCDYFSTCWLGDQEGILWRNRNFYLWMLQETAKESIVRQKFQGKEGWAVEMKDTREKRSRVVTLLGSRPHGPHGPHETSFTAIHFSSLLGATIILHLDTCKVLCLLATLLPLSLLSSWTLCPFSTWWPK